MLHHMSPTSELPACSQRDTCCRDTVTYDLRQRGVCVLSGRNEDDAGAESNGSGKSSLAMSALWAITGKSDARMEVGCQRSCSAYWYEKGKRHGLKGQKSCVATWMLLEQHELPPSHSNQIRTDLSLSSGHLPLLLRDDCTVGRPGQGPHQCRGGQ